jgi:hypothetical protein
MCKGVKLKLHKKMSIIPTSKEMDRPGTPLWDTKKAGLVLPWVWSKSTKKRRWVEITLTDEYLKYNKEIAEKMLSKPWAKGNSTEFTINPWTGTPVEIHTFDLDPLSSEIPMLFTANPGVPYSIGLAGLFKVLEIEK